MSSSGYEHTSAARARVRLSEAPRATRYGDEAGPTVGARVGCHARALQHPIASRSDELAIREDDDLSTLWASERLAVVAVGASESPGHQVGPGLKMVLEGVILSPSTVFWAVAAPARCRFTVAL